MRVGSDGGMILSGEPKNSEKTCPSATLSTTNSIWADPGTNPGLCGERLVTNHLSHVWPYGNIKNVLFSTGKYIVL
jgi:hypothetical protein